MNPKKRTPQLAVPVAGEDRLGRLGAADGLRSGRFQGFTVPASAIKHLETQNGILYLELDDKQIKHRKMLIEPLSFVLEVPPTGPGARRYMNNYISIAETYGGVEKAKLGKESTTAGEKVKMVYNIAIIGLDVTSVMFGDFFSIIDVATGVNGLGHRIGLNQRQAQRLGHRAAAGDPRNRVQGHPHRAGESGVQEGAEVKSGGCATSSPACGRS